MNSGETLTFGTPAQDTCAWDEGGWRDRAACRGQDPELFFPAGSTGAATLEQIAAAKATCARCPVREACLRFALRTGQAYGIWGRLTEDERRKLRRRRVAALIGRPQARDAPGAGRTLRVNGRAPG